MGAVVSMINEMTQFILDYLTDVKDKSDNTYIAYKKDIETFFGKGIHYITKKDILDLTLSDFKGFIRKQKENNLNNKSINRSIAAVKELLNFLVDEEVISKSDIKYLKKLKRLKENKNLYAVITKDEVEQMADWALNHELHDSIIKYYLIMLGFETCFRQAELLILKWSDFTIQNDLDLVKVHVIGKGNKDYNAIISIEVFDEMKKALYKENEERIFNLTSDKINNMMARYRKYFNIPKERNVVFHSIRKAGAYFKYVESGYDILVAQKALGHSNVKTTMDYLNIDDQLVLGGWSVSKDVDQEAYKKLSHEELLDILGKMSGDYLWRLNREISKMKGNRDKSNN